MQKNTLLRLAGAMLVVGSLAACADPYGQYGISPDVQRAAGGAVAGAVVAKAVDGNARTGALVGATAGALCDDLGICQ
ncbi:MAG: hypothetical protein Q4F71_06145 [Paracoccus sp. (in: a-proteobacteria)]|nr:hypothetical protein [Paracoccus sp. (in: a-proteobacteria)]